MSGKYRSVPCENKERIFRVERALCFGVKNNERGGELYPYTVPISLRDYQEIIEEIRRIESKYNCEKCIYGETIYLSLKEMDYKQKEDLYLTGFKYIAIKFTLKGVKERIFDGKKDLNFEINNLEKVGDF